MAGVAFAHPEQIPFFTLQCKLTPERVGVCWVSVSEGVIGGGCSTPVFIGTLGGGFVVRPEEGLDQADEEEGRRREPPQEGCKMGPCKPHCSHVECLKHEHQEESTDPEYENRPAQFSCYSDSLPYGSQVHRDVDNPAAAGHSPNTRRCEASREEDEGQQTKEGGAETRLNEHS